jgi:hypothetical protein
MRQQDFEDVVRVPRHALLPRNRAEPSRPARGRDSPIRPSRLGRRFATRRAVPMSNHTRNAVQGGHQPMKRQRWRAGSRRRLKLPGARPPETRKRLSGTARPSPRCRAVGSLGSP